MTNEKKYEKAAENEVQPSRCPKCGSTNRGQYHQVRNFNMKCANTDDKGQLYNRVTWKRTKCRDCGQSRVDRFREYDPPKKGTKKKAAPKPKQAKPKKGTKKKAAPKQPDLNSAPDIVAEEF